MHVLYVHNPESTQKITDSTWKEIVSDEEIDCRLENHGSQRDLRGQ